MKHLEVENMESPNGNYVPNQFIIKTPEGTYFQSYRSIIAFIPAERGKKIQLDKYYWNYSNTTGKYRNIFLGETLKETKKKIESGVYELVELN